MERRCGITDLYTTVVNTNNECLTEKNPVSDSIFKLVRPDLKEEIQKLNVCLTGKAKLTKGFKIATHLIIHTSEPKYKSRYPTAPEGSL